MSDQKGFTAIEMLVTLFIVSVITVIAVPRFISFNDEQQLDLEAARLASDLRYLQEIARTTKRQHLNFLHVPSEAQPTINFISTGYMLYKNNDVILRHTYPTGLTISHSGVSPSSPFPAFGQNGDASPFTVTMKLGKASRKVIVDTVGRVRVQ